MITQEMILAAKNAETNVAALIAVYPLILEQAAGVCDAHSEFSNIARLCASEIRNLKDKTDD